MFLTPLFLVAVGIVFPAFPDRIRRYDQRMTRLIKGRDEYVLTLRLMGLFFVVTGSFLSAMFLLGLMR